jgi:hypothetical protein
MKQISVSTNKPPTDLANVKQWQKNFLSRVAASWRFSPQIVAIICLLPFVVALLGAGTALLGKTAYKWLTGEDGFAETAQVIFYLLTFGLSLLVARRHWGVGHKLIAGLYLGLSLALLFLIGEELSWGQRIFGWQTASSVAAINKQGETNLHNIHGVGDTFKWIQMLVGAYGAFLPLALLRWTPPVQLRKLVAAVTPHYTLIPYFFFLFIWRLYRNLLEPPQALYFVISEYNEVLELVLAMGFFFFVVYQLRQIKTATP